MSNTDFDSPSPQLGTAEYAGRPGNDHCYVCHLPTATTYYRVNEALACSGCTETMQAELAKDTHSAFMRALLSGTGAAIAGMILYATFVIATGIIIGYVSLAVGWMVGKAIIKGSGSSGVTTVYQNGSPTNLKCTLGTSTSCHDTSGLDAFTFNASDTWSVRTTSAGSGETLANVRATFQCQ